ncbi:MAG: DUF1573 domain-containing protein [Muribaculum sp.]|nr:DUF1573 domain-containing protein [Muribaculum sp.]
MNRILTLIAVMLLSISTVLAGGTSKIKIPEKSFDFGNIQEADGPVSHEFIIENVGEAPLIVISANAQCGCTTPIIPKEPIKSGEKASINVTYNPSGRPGEFQKTITVKTNAKPNSFKLKISGVVIPKSK